MGILTTKTFSSSNGDIEIPVKELEIRVIQRYENTYTGGSWNSGTGYSWVPGGFVDFTPERADSRICFIYRVPVYRPAANHGISHWRFYVDGVEYFYHSTSMTYYEDGATHKWDVPSWGTNTGRIGYQMRQYGNNQIRPYGTTYWNGTSSTQNAFGQLIVEEYVQTSSPAFASQQTITAG